MRWFWFDRYTEFVSGKHAVGIKNVTLAEEHLHDHFPGCPVMPNALIIEGLAQTGGLLVSEAQNYERRWCWPNCPRPSSIVRPIRVTR